MSLNQDPKKGMEEKSIDEESDCEMSAAEMIKQMIEMQEHCETVKEKIGHSKWVCQQLEEQLKEQKKEMKGLKDLRRSKVSDSKKEVLPLRESIKRLSRKNRELTKANNALEDEIDDEEGHCDELRSIVVQLTREQVDWMEKTKLCQRIAGGDNSEFKKKKSKFVAQLKEMMWDDEMDILKDLKKDLNELLEMQKKDFERETVSEQQEQMSKQETNELETKCEELETRRKVLAELNAEWDNLPESAKGISKRKRN